MEQQILIYIENSSSDMLKAIEHIVNIDSGSKNPIGTTAVGKYLSDFVAGLGFSVEAVECGEYGITYVARRPGKSGKIVLLGHTDTVFLDGEVSRRPFTIKGNRAYGPGVADMKAGLVTTIYALAALVKAGWEEKNIVIIWNSHEEIGSTYSRNVIEAESKGADAVYNMEPARPNGAVVTSRKGVAWAHLKVTGKAAHAGVEPEKGINAIEELSYKVIAFNRLTDLKSGTTVNVGVSRGGTATNVVPDSAELWADIRFCTNVEAQKTMSEMEQIAATSSLAGATSHLNTQILFKPMERTKGVIELYEKARAIAAELGFDLPEAFTGGGADSGFTTGVGAPTLCGMGPIGGGAHGVDEYLEVDSIVPRCKLLALCMLRL